MARTIKFESISDVRNFVANQFNFSADEDGVQFGRAVEMIRDQISFGETYATEQNDDGYDVLDLDAIYEAALAA